MSPATLTLASQHGSYTDSGMPIALNKAVITPDMVTFISDPLSRLAYNDLSGSDSVTPMGRVARVSLGHRPLGKTKRISSAIKQVLPCVTGPTLDNEEDVVFTLSVTRGARNDTVVVLDGIQKFITALTTGGGLNGLLDELASGSL